MTRFFAVFRFLVSSSALLGALALPSGVSAWFDGMPWANAAETVGVAVAVPFLLCLGWRFLTKGPVAAAAVFLFLLKAVLGLSAPPAGWDLRVYSSIENLKKQKWERTYTTLWKEGVSEVLDRPLRGIREFPVEFMNADSSLWRLARGQIPAGAPFSDPRQAEFARAIKDPRFKKEQSFQDEVFALLDALKLAKEAYFARHFWLGVELRGHALLPPGAGLAVVAASLKEGSIEATDASGRRWRVPLVKSMERAARLRPGELPGGKLRVEGRLVYSGGFIRRDTRLYEPEKWSLIPVAVHPGGRVVSALAEGLLWRTETAWALSPARLAVLRFLARAVDLGLLLFLGGWFLWSVKRLLDERVLNPALLVLSGLLAALLALKPAFVGRAFPVAGLVCFALMGRDFWRGRVKRLGWALLFVAGLALFLYFLMDWWHLIGKMEFFSSGDDWRTYQNLGRQIVVGGDWWHARYFNDGRTNIWHYQPLYRYVVGISHLLFGQSPLAQFLLDAWAVLGATVALAFMGERLRLAPGFALALPWLYLGATMTSAFRGQIGSGLQEYTAMLLMMLATWGALASRASGWATALGAGLLAAVGYLLRQDHLGALAASGLLALEPVRGGFAGAWRVGLGALRRHAGWVTVFLLTLALAPLAVASRNWYFAGHFVLTNLETNMAHALMRDAATVGKNLLILLNASRHGIAAGAGWTLWAGTLLGMAGLFLRQGPLSRYPLTLGVMLAGLIAPYFLFSVDNYPPRFSVHLLPVAVLSLVAALDSAWAWLSASMTSWPIWTPSGARSRKRTSRGGGTYWIGTSPPS